MRNFELKAMLTLVIVIIGFVLFSAFTVKVKPAEVVIKVDLYGSDKGVESEVLPTGRQFYNSITHDIVKYPAYVQNQTFHDVYFKDKDALKLNADFTIDYQFDPEKIPEVYTTYRKDAQQIREQYFGKWLQDAIVTTASTAGMSAEDLISKDLENFKGLVRDSLVNRFENEGIIIRDVYVSDLVIPEAITNKINEKIQATQDAQKKENELRSTQAEVEKAVAVEEGKARSRKIESESRAEANKILNESLTPQVLEFKRLELQKDAIIKWNGAMPKVQGNSGGLILDIGSLQ